MTDCDHKLTAVSLNFAARTITVRCDDCGHEQVAECEFVINSLGEVQAIAWPGGFVKHIETRIEFEAASSDVDACPAKSPHNG